MLEYGIAWDITPTELHRGPFSQEVAEEWIRDWEGMSPNARKGMFVIVCREVSDWRVGSPTEPSDSVYDLRARNAALVEQNRLHNVWHGELQERINGSS